MIETKIQEWKDKINNMSHKEMAKLHRFAPLGHVVFQYRLPLYKIFEDRFRSLGGMTAAISKTIGWRS